MAPTDPLTGYANADNIGTIGKDELGDYLGGVTRHRAWPTDTPDMTSTKGL